MDYAFDNLISCNRANQKIQFQCKNLQIDYFLNNLNSS